MSGVVKVVVYGHETSFEARTNREVKYDFPISVEATAEQGGSRTEEYPKSSAHEIPKQTFPEAILGGRRVLMRSSLNESRQRDVDRKSSTNVRAGYHSSILDYTWSGRSPTP